MASIDVYQEVDYEGYASEYAYATITWNESLKVTVTVTGSNVATWRIRGRGSDSTEYLLVTSGGRTGTFYAENGKSYAFQIYSNVKKKYSDGAFFTVSNDSGGGDSGGGSGGGNSGSATAHYLHIDEGEGTYLYVERTWAEKQDEGGFFGEMVDGDRIWMKDCISVTATALEGYTLDTYKFDLFYKLNYSISNLHWADSNHDVLCLSSEDDAFISSTATLKQYTLSIPKIQNATLTVNRLSSYNITAPTGKLTDSDTIYYYDRLEITCEPNTGYKITELTINEEPIESGDIYTVYGGITISAATEVISSTLTLNPDTKSKITVNRTKSPLKGATTGTIAEAEDNNVISDIPIYYSDELQVIFYSSPEFKIQMQLLNQSPWESGATYVAIGEDVEITTITELSGVVHIFDGTEFKNYLIYIYNGSSWDQYIPYVFDGTKWCICS